MSASATNDFNGTVPEHFVKQVWLGFLDSDRLSRYYDRLTSKYQRINKAFYVTITILSSTAVVSFVAVFPDWLLKTIVVVIGALVLWVRFSDYSIKIQESSKLADQCGILSLKWKELWLNISVTEDINTQLFELSSQLHEITKNASKLGITNHNRLHRKCAEETYATAEAEFSGA